MSETDIMRRCLVALSQAGAKVFRNQVGSYELADGRRIRSGLCVGSSDIVGFRSIEVTPAMVGKKLAVFTAIEVKTPTGRTSPEQVNFLRAVHEAGGISGIARSPEEALDILHGHTLL